MSQPRAPAHSVRVILNTALWVTALGVVVRASGAIKEIIFAGAFGVSAETDAFVLAITYATFLPTVVAGAIGTALIAHLAKVRTSAAFPRYWGLSLGIWIAAAGVACALLIYFSAPLLLRVVFGLDGEQLARAVWYSAILSPLAALMVWAAAMDAVLNSAKQFYVPALAVLATPLATIIAIAGWEDARGVEAAAWGMLVGGALEVLILLARITQSGAARAAAVEPHGDAVAASSALRAPGDGAFWRSAGVLSFAGGLAALAAVVDQVFLAKLETGAVTNFNYAYKVNSLLISLFGSAFAAVIYPYLSDLAAARNKAGLKRLSVKLAAIVLPLVFSVSVIVFAFSYEIVELLFVRGNFARESAVEVSAIQRIFAFQLVFYVAGLLATRVLNAMNATNYILWISCVGLVSVAFFDWLLYTSLGASGIALAAVITSVNTLAAALFFINLCYRR